MTDDHLPDVAALEERLSRPTAALLADLAEVPGELVVLGAGGKMGPSLVRMAARAGRVVHAVSGFSQPGLQAELEAAGVHCHRADLLERGEVERLPDAANVIFMAGRKFGSTGAEPLTWATNAWLPGLVAERYRGRRIVVFSSGNVYPLVDVTSGGATEATPPAPIGEYAQSVLGRERLFEYFAVRYGSPTLLFRLNYAVEPRYGVLRDIAERVWTGQPIELTTGYVNVIWQGDANALALRCLKHCAVPAATLNVTGPETVSVRALAERFGELLGRPPRLVGREAPTALCSNASRARELFGPPEVALEQVLVWVAAWVRAGGPGLGKPTHYEVRDGRF